MDEERRDSTGAVAVRRISQQRLARWVADCARDHATPLVLVAIGHDEQAGTLHAYRTEDGPSDADVAVLLRALAAQMARQER